MEQNLSLKSFLKNNYNKYCSQLVKRTPSFVPGSRYHNLFQSSVKYEYGTILHTKTGCVSTLSTTRGCIKAYNCIL